MRPSSRALFFYNLPLSGLLTADEVNSHMDDYDFAVLALERILDAIDKLIDAAETIIDAMPEDGQ